MALNYVIDTCTLVHADNCEEVRQRDSIELINYLNRSIDTICVDEGFSLDETKNKSHIGYEYIKHLHQGMLGYALIATLAAIGRIDIISSATHPHIAKKINRCIANKGDRIFLKVAYNSKSKILVSHDHTDFPVSKRDYIKSEFEVYVVEAKDM